MKWFLLIIIVTISSAKLLAQDMAAVKELMAQHQLVRAKDLALELDKAQPEEAQVNYILSQLYFDINDDKLLSDRYIGYLDSSRVYYIGFANLKASSIIKAEELDLSKKISTAYYQLGSQQYNAALRSKQPIDFRKAYEPFKKAFEFTELVQAGYVDTLSRYFAAISAIKANLEIEGLIAGKKLIDYNIKQSGNNSFYQLWQWMAYYYTQQQRATLLDAFAEKAEIVFPGSSYFKLQQATLAEKMNNSTILMAQLEKLLQNTALSSQEELSALQIAEKAMNNENISKIQARVYLFLKNRYINIISSKTITNDCNLILKSASFIEYSNRLIGANSFPKLGKKQVLIVKKLLELVMLGSIKANSTQKTAAANSLKNIKILVANNRF